MRPSGWAGDVWICYNHIPSVHLPANTSKCWYAGCKSVRPDRADEKPAPQVVKPEPQVVIPIRPVAPPIPQITATPSSFDIMDEAMLMGQSLDALRSYAARDLKIAGASKIPGGKRVLVDRILVTRAGSRASARI